MADLTDSQQSIFGANMVIGLRDGNQTIAPSDFTKYRQIFLTGASVAGRVVTLPPVAALRNITSDLNNSYPIIIKRGTTEIIINPGQIKTIETDSSANGLSDETGSPALAGFSDEVPLPDGGAGDPGSSVYPARADHQHPAAAGSVTSVAGRSGDIVLAEADVANLTSDLAALVAADGSLNANKVAKGGDTMTGPLTLAGAPTSNLHAATKAYVDATAQGLAIKVSVKAATTVAGGNITLSGAQTIDAVALIAGNRVLVKNQSDPTQNGIYVVASGAWSRSTDADVWSELPGAFTFVESGTANGGTSWVCNVASGGTIGIDNITFAQFGSGATYVAGALISISGSSIAAKTDSATPAEETDTGTAGVADAAARSDHAHPAKLAIRKMTGPYTAKQGDIILADTSVAGFTINVPPGTTAGRRFQVLDASGTFDVNPLIIGRNGQTIQNVAEDMTVDTAGASFELQYSGSTWRLA